jgi:hypothetical protein
MSLALCNTYGQARNNLPKLIFDNSSDILSKATGWGYNSEHGEWIDYDNVICSNKTYKTIITSLAGVGYILSHYYQNFITIQTKSLTFENTKYYVIIIEKWYGLYRYPSIWKDWIESKRRHGYIYTEEEYNKIKNISGMIELRSIAHIEKDNEEDMLDNIRNFLMKRKKPEDIYESRYSVDIFPILKSQEGMIRFYIPMDYLAYERIDFEEAYFETEPENFEKMILQ